MTVEQQVHSSKSHGGASSGTCDNPDAGGTAAPFNVLQNELKVVPVGTSLANSAVLLIR